MFLIFPFLGIFFYFLLGFDSIHKDHGDRYTDIYLRYKRYEISSFKLDIDKRDPKFKTFAHNFVRHKAPVYKNTDIFLLDDSYSTLKEITNLILNAKSFIHMEFYIFGEGLVFQHIFDLFNKKIQEGVEIRLIVDYVGNYGRLSRRSIKKLKSIGVQVRVFNPLFRSNNLWWQFRNHNKILLVDNQYALFGSCNIADEYFKITDKYFQTTELSAKLSGSIVNSVSALFLAHWDLSNNKKNRNMPEFDQEKCKSYFSRLHINEEENNSYSQFLDNSPISNEFIIKDNLMQLIFNAQKSIVISTPYFFPPKEIVNALKQAKAVGVSIKILVPKNPDLTGFFKTLNRQLFSILLEQDIEIYEYFGFNHEKLMIIDDEMVYFGSYNWDYRSLYLNFENAFLVKSEKISAAMTKFMNQQFTNSHKISCSDLKKSSASLFKNSFIRLFKPFL